jgi:hypothetical protein
MSVRLCGGAACCFLFIAARRRVTACHIATGMPRPGPRPGTRERRVISLRNSRELRRHASRVLRARDAHTRAITEQIRKRWREKW